MSQLWPFKSFCPANQSWQPTGTAVDDQRWTVKCKHRSRAPARRRCTRTRRCAECRGGGGDHRGKFRHAATFSAGSDALHRCHALGSRMARASTAAPARPSRSRRRRARRSGPRTDPARRWRLTRSAALVKIPVGSRNSPPSPHAGHVWRHTGPRSGPAHVLPSLLPRGSHRRRSGGQDVLPQSDSGSGRFHQ
jgi:hypothetical protein